MRSNTKKKLAPIVTALVVAAVALPIVVGVMKAIGLIGFLSRKGVGLAVLAVLVIYGLVAAAIFVGVLAAMRERLREIDGGEEDEAKKY